MNKFKNILLIVIVSLGSTVFAQQKVDLPKAEPRPYFKLIPYPRGFEKDSTERLMNYLLEKPQESWNKKDSIDYLFALCSSENYDLAFTIFEKLKTKDLPSIEELHIIQQMLLFKRRYVIRHDWLDLEAEKLPFSQSKIDLRKRITDVHQLNSKREWSLQDSVVFPLLKDSSLLSLKKGSTEYMQLILPLANLIDDALRDETKYESSSNRALSLAFLEFGDFLYAKVSLSDAYIAYSIARYYDAYNNEISIKLRAIKTEINDNNFILPSIRETFPKQRKGLFNFQKIMEKRKKQRDSTQIESSPPLIIELDEDAHKKEVLKGFWDEAVILIGLILILVCVLLFVKVKR